MPFRSAIDGTEVVFTDGVRVLVKNGTDADILSSGVLWQVKTGGKALEPHEIEMWLRQAHEAIKANGVPGATRVGIRLDTDAAAKFGVDIEGNFIATAQTAYKNIIRELEELYGQSIKIEVFRFPNP